MSLTINSLKDYTVYNEYAILPLHHGVARVFSLIFCSMLCCYVMQLAGWLLSLKLVKCVVT